MRYHDEERCDPMPQPERNLDVDIKSLAASLRERFGAVEAAKVLAGARFVLLRELQQMAEDAKKDAQTQAAIFNECSEILENVNPANRGTKQN